MVSDKGELRVLPKYHYLVGVNCMSTITSLHTELLIVNYFYHQVSVDRVLVNLLFGIIK